MPSVSAEGTLSISRFSLNEYLHALKTLNKKITLFNSFMKSLVYILGLTIIALSAFSACSSINHLSTGRTDRLKKGEFYKTYESRNLPDDTSSIGLLPVTVQPNMEDRDFEYDRDDPLLIELTDSISAKISRLPISFISLSDYTLADSKNGPGVYVGSSEGYNVPDGASIVREDIEKYPPMVIYMEKAKDDWKVAASNTAADYEADYLLRIWISFAEYPKSDKGLVKRMVVLGTDYEIETRFFSSEDKPLEVLQLSGYVADKNGNIVRAGAEGVIHNDTPFWLQVLDVKELIDDEMLVRLLHEERREDLPGNPLVLDVALENLIAQLLDRGL